MPRFYWDYMYLWGYTALALGLFVVTCIASWLMLSRCRSLGLWMLSLGSISVTASMCISDVAWLILAGGKGSIDGIREPDKAAILDSLPPYIDGFQYAGATGITLAMLFIGRDIRRGAAHDPKQN